MLNFDEICRNFANVFRKWKILWRFAECIANFYKISKFHEIFETETIIIIHYSTNLLNSILTTTSPSARWDSYCVCGKTEEVRNSCFFSRADRSSVFGSNLASQFKLWAGLLPNFRNLISKFKCKTSEFSQNQNLLGKWKVGRTRWRFQLPKFPEKFRQSSSTSGLQIGLELNSNFKLSLFLNFRTYTVPWTFELTACLIPKMQQFPEKS